MSVLQRFVRGLKWSGGFAVYHLPFLAGVRRDYMARMYSMPDKRGWLFRSFRSYVLGACAYQQLPQFRTAILTGESGRRWAEFYRSRPDDYYLEGFREQLRACESLLENGTCSRFLQIGCAGGRELAILAAKFPNVSFCGLDLNADAIRENQEVYSAFKNLQFRAADLTSPENWAAWHPDVVYSSGCLEYLTEEEAGAFIRSAHQAGVSHLLLCEPTDASVKVHSVQRGGAAFAHDYRHLTSQGGWQHVNVLREPTVDKNLLLLIASCDGSPALCRSDS